MVPSQLYRKAETVCLPKFVKTDWAPIAIRALQRSFLNEIPILQNKKILETNDYDARVLKMVGYQAYSQAETLCLPKSVKTDWAPIAIRGLQTSIWNEIPIQQNKKISEITDYEA